MNTTTIKIHKSTKWALDELMNDSETYDDAISKLIIKNKNRNLKKELINGYKEAAKRDLEILNEWESASLEL